MNNVVFSPIPIEDLIDQVATKVVSIIFAKDPVQTTQTDEILDINEAAAFLGLKRSTLYNRSDIPRLKQGKKNYYSRQQLTEWLKSSPVKTKSSIDIEVDQDIRRKMRRKKDVVKFKAPSVLKPGA